MKSHPLRSDNLAIYLSCFLFLFGSIFFARGEVKPRLSKQSSASQESNDLASENETKKLQERQWGAGYRFRSFHYDEYKFATERGTLSGLDFFFRQNTPITSIKVNFFYLQGGLRYDGYLDDEPIRSTTVDWIWGGAALTDLKLVGGLRFSTGLEFQSWFNRINGIGGYRRQNSRLGLPIGVVFERGGDTLSWQLGLFAKWLVWGLNKTYLQDVDSLYPTVYLRQRQGFGRSLTGQVRYQPWKNSGFLLAGEYTIWDIDNSETRSFALTDGVDSVTFFVTEPANKMTTLDFSLNYFRQF